VGKLIGILVVVAIGVFALWLFVDRALFRFGAIGGLVFAFLLVYLLFYLVDRRKIKESEDLIADREPFDPDPNVRR
jgi:membrane associated rhomboid family serine protease